MACENALSVGGTDHEPPNDITRLMRNIIMGAEFVMSHITHFYALAALSYVQGPSIPPWTPYFDNSYYVDHLEAQNATPRMSHQNVTGDNYTALDGIWDNVVLDYVTALKYRRDAANASAILGGRTPMIQNACLIGGSAHQPTADDLNKVKALIAGCAGFIQTHQVPLTHILSYLYPAYNNDGTNPDSGYGSGSTGGGAQRVLAWGAFDLDMNGGDDPVRLLRRGCYEFNAGSMDEVDSPGNLWNDLKEYIDNSKYDSGTAFGLADPASGLHPSSGYTNPASGNGGYSWAKSPRIVDGGTPKACQVGPLARMAVQGERDPGTNVWDSYQIGSTRALDVGHPYLTPILLRNLTAIQAAYGPLPSSLLCGFSTMDRHRARAYEGLKIAKAISDTGGWCDELSGVLGGTAYTTWTAPSTTDGNVKSGYGAHEAPRGALAHFVEITNGKISNYQAVVPTTWNVNPEAPSGTHGPIEDAVIGTSISGTLSATHEVPVEALRVVQGFDPCIACTVH